MRFKKVMVAMANKRDRAKQKRIDKDVKTWLLLLSESHGWIPRELTELFMFALGCSLWRVNPVLAAGMWVVWRYLNHFFLSWMREKKDELNLTNLPTSRKIQDLQLPSDLSLQR
jgi:hypothetical protein